MNENYLTFNYNQNVNPSLEEELRDLEDTYAECLADNIDAKTLNSIWLRIKAIKKEFYLSLEAA